MSLALFLDVDNRRLVRSAADTTAFALPAWVQGDRIKLRIFPLSATGNDAAPYEPLDWSECSVRAGVCGGTGAPTGTTDEPETVAEAELEWDGDAATGLLDLDRFAVEDFVGAADAKNSTFEIEVTDPDAGERITFQFPCFVAAEVLEDPVPTSSSSPSSMSSSLSSQSSSSSSPSSSSVSSQSSSSSSSSSVSSASSSSSSSSPSSASSQSSLSSLSSASSASSQSSSESSSSTSSDAAPPGIGEMEIGDTFVVA